MVPGGGEEGTSIFDQDSEQSKPLLGDDYDRDGTSSAALPAGAKKKVAEYLSAAEGSVSVVHRVLHGLYGHLPREDVPRIVWFQT
ncbi:unnamed protein product [Ectocarpus sp. 12 AP-2014]